jgi:hypothetical protein
LGKCSMISTSKIIPHGYFISVFWVNCHHFKLVMR